MKSIAQKQLEQLSLGYVRKKKKKSKKTVALRSELICFKLKKIEADQLRKCAADKQESVSEYLRNVLQKIFRRKTDE